MTIKKSSSLASGVGVGRNLYPFATRLGEADRDGLLGVCHLLAGLADGELTALHLVHLFADVIARSGAVLAAGRLRGGSLCG